MPDQEIYRPWEALTAPGVTTSFNRLIDYDYLIETLDPSSTRGKMYLGAMEKWVRFILGWRQLTSLAGDMRDGGKFGCLLQLCGLEGVELPYPEPKGKKECVGNNFHLLSLLEERSGGKIDDETKDSISFQIYQGSEQQVGGFIIQIIRHLRFGEFSDAVHDRHGLDHLEHWCREVVKMDKFNRIGGMELVDLDHPGNLERLLRHCRVGIVGDKYGNMSSSEARRLYLLEAIRRETGIPVLAGQAELADEQAARDVMWYLFLRYTWLAEVYLLYVKSNKDLAAKKPSEVIVGAIQSSHELERSFTKLDANCRVLYHWVQDRIKCYKAELQSFATQNYDGTRDISSLTTIYKTLTGEQGAYSKMRQESFRLHCEIQAATQRNGRDHVDYDPTYNIHKVEHCWSKMIQLQEAVQERIMKYISHSQNKAEIIEQWKNEVAAVKSWREGWDDFLVKFCRRTSNYSATEFGSFMKTFKSQFALEVEQKNGLEHLNLLARLITELDPSEDKRILRQTKLTGEQYGQFVTEVPALFRSLEEQLERVRKVEGLHCRVARLTDKLDEQIHDLYSWYILRPHLHTVRGCDKLTNYIADTWPVMFEVARELNVVLSLEKEIEDLESSSNGFGHLMPKNDLSRRTVEYVCQRWETLLEEARRLEIYVAEERSKCAAIEPIVQLIHEKTGVVASKVKRNMLEICRYYRAEKYEDVRTVRENLQKLLDELVASFLEEVHSSVPSGKLSEMAVDRISSLRECIVHCLSAADLALEDVEALRAVVASRSITDKVLQNYIRLYRNLGAAELNLLFYKHDTLRHKLLYVEIPRLHEERFILEPGTGAVEEKAERISRDQEEADKRLGRVKNYADCVDPMYGRVTLSAWVLNMISNDTSLKSTALDLRDILETMGGNEKFVTESTLRQYVDPAVANFTLKHMTEYLGAIGPGLERQRKNGERFLDYSRFVSNIAGEGRKFPINLE